MNKIIAIEHPGYRGETEVRLHTLEGLNGEADTALRLIQHLSIACAMPDGEDSNGRQKLRMMLPEEISQRACEIAEKIWMEFRNRNWTVEMPIPKLPKSKEEL